MTVSTLHRTIVLAIAALLITAAPASAHHAMGGGTPSTFVEGLFSGLGHPVIGPDHLAFLIAVGVAVGVGGLSLTLPVLFVAASAIGVVMHVYGFSLPASESIIAVSVVIVGLLIARGRELPLAVWAALFGAAGLAHGYAFGESIYGAETAPLGAYLLGLVVIQSAIALGVAFLWRGSGATVSAMAPRLAGAVVIGVGLAVLIGQLIPTV